MAKAKRIKGINCKSVASAGIKLVLLTRFDELCSFQAMALDWTDPEGVHSMRVASRRLRSALRDFMPYIRKRPLAQMLKQLRSIADALGEVRDQDVAIEALEEMVGHAPAALASGLSYFIETRKQLREQARDELKSILEASELKQLESQFIAGVDGATATHAGSPAITFSTMSREQWPAQSFRDRDAARHAHRRQAPALCARAFSAMLGPRDFRLCKTHRTHTRRAGRFA
jgi:CHAD domain-containing protein